MKRGTPRHPKIWDLLDALELPLRSRAVVIGYLELLWHFTAEFAPQGDIGRYSDDRIEGAMDWYGTRGKLIEALVRSNWIDRIAPPEGESDLPPTSTDTHVRVTTNSSRCRLVVHDWHDHADDATRKRLSRLGLPFLSDTAKLTGKCQQPIRTTAENICLPEPLPKPQPQPQPQTPKAPPLPCSSEYPLTLNAIREHDPAADSLFAARLVQETIQHCLSSREFPQEKLPKVTDAIIAECVGESYKTKPNNHGTGLLLRRVPQIVVTGFTQDAKSR